MYKLTSKELTVKNNRGIGIAYTNFGISFNHNGIEIKIQLENGEDLLKLATLFEKLLKKNKIPYRLEKNNYNQI